MAIVRVGDTRVEQTAHSATISATYAATTGNTLIVVVSYWSGTAGGSQTCSVSDGTNTYTQDVYSHGPSTTRSGSFTFHASNITGGSLTITATTNDSNAFLMIEVIEYSGLATSSARDGSGFFAVGTSTSSATGPFTVGFTPELLISGITTDSTTNGSTITAGSGWTMVFSEASAGTYMNWAVMEQFTSGLRTFNATATNVNAAWTISFVAFKGLGAAPAGAGTAKGFLFAPLE